MDVADRIRAFIREEIVLDAEAHVADDTPLLEGIVDSLAMMQLVDYLEEEFDAEIDERDIKAENFGTVRAIERLVNERLART
jgi:methoxymalonate biosynthesis acyl carrier protein